ncbi:MAG: NAD(P)H-hydrate dehydratase [Candidatus Aenigmarchaeota archaeon]|nr:NAD(P)H-hydrate dehydratase [Candidatus Aenigmarchaeota archaeon]
MFEVDSSILSNIYKKRPKWSHKGDFGKLLIIGGSKVYTGAPALAAYSAIAALRSGADIAYVIAPRRAADVIASFSPNLIAEPVGGEYFTKGHLKHVLEVSKKFDAISIGSGLGMRKETQDFVLKFLGKVKKPCVIDADAIKALKKRRLGKNFVLTPHSYEFYAFSGEKPTYDILNRAKMVKKFAKRLDATILLKGAIDIISDGSKVATNKTGNPYMTTGGTGDVLTGVCGGLLAQGVLPFEAACASAYITGKAGDFAAKEKGPGLLATDIIEKIPYVIKEVMK